MQNKDGGAKILLLDIETAPAKCYSWGLWDQNIGINQVIEDGYVLCWCAKWFGEKKIMHDALMDHPEHFKKNPMCDKKIALSIWHLLDKADIVVTHNGNSFDLKWLNTIFIKNHLPPVGTYKSVDTCNEIKRNFRFLSNKLDFVVRKLELGYKISTGGFELWTACMKGDEKAWAKMVTYCEHDVRILERLYSAIRPYIKTHPNLCLYNDKAVDGCPNCGGKDLAHKGWVYTQTAKYQRSACLNCGRKFKTGPRIKT